MLGLKDSDCNMTNRADRADRAERPEGDRPFYQPVVLFLFPASAGGLKWMSCQRQKRNCTRTV
jgi:hypothetical protein